MKGIGYYQPAGPLISHYHAAASSSTSALPAVSAPPAVATKGSPGPEPTSRPGDPPSEPPPPQEYRPPPFASAGYPPPPHNYYPYIQPPYQECYSPYLKYPPHPGFRRGYWPGHGPAPGASSTSGVPMVTSDPYHGPPPGPGGPIEPFPHPHPVAQPPPQPYYYPHAAPPTCYSHPAPLRAPMFMSDPSYQPCPCPTMSSFPKNVLTGPLTGASKGPGQQQAQNSAQMSQQVTTVLSSSEQQAQQQGAQQQGLSVPAATQPASSMPNVALALSLETNNPNNGPPSPARGSAGLPPPASPALSTARNPPSWSPPNIIETEPTKETKTREEIRPVEPSHPQTLVAEGPPVLENQVQAAQRRPRPPKRKPSIERQVSPVAEEREAEPDRPLSVPEPSPEVVPKRRRSVTPVRSKSEPIKTPPVSTRGQTKKPADKPLTAVNPEKKPKLTPPEVLKPVANGIPKTVTNGVPKIMDGAIVKKVNVIQKPAAPLLKNGISKSAKTVCQAAVQKMLLKNCPKTSIATVPLKTVARTKKDITKAKVIKSEPKRSGKKPICKELVSLASPTKTHPNGLKWSNGWSWEGEGFKARVFLAGDETPVFRRCFPAMRHIEGDIIYPMDCILLKSGPRKQQLPFIAKVASLWENPDDGEMMISLLWYYRPEHTDMGRQPLQPDDEVFASRHRDTNSVACIEDKCYVLTFNEYCRYKKSLSASEFGVSMDKVRRVVPQPDYYPRSRRLPAGRIANELLFFCRKVYDFRTKRLLKKPY
ncbi:hypothetical protein GE061_012483 [Apolygus lucorum]|uniref:Uncharacterized protein n=1 Tax=Apolygus lucorum TaxID=248454 RepID=A0A6A4K0Q3_APOLU|nr:hypothetical protein GE061_012483 [Apolygus lucorum]